MTVKQIPDLPVQFVSERLMMAGRRRAHVPRHSINELPSFILGHWRHVEGIGNVWNWEFFEAERSAHYFSTNMILGDSSTWYHWIVDSGEIGRVPGWSSIGG